MLRAAVPQRIADRLLEDHQQPAAVAPEFRRRRPFFAYFDHSLPMRHAARRIAEEPGQSIGLAAGRLEIPEDVPQRRLRKRERLLGAHDLPDRLARIFDDARRGVEPEHGAGEELLELVVQIVRQAPPFVFRRLRRLLRLLLRVDGPVQEQYPDRKKCKRETAAPRRRRDLRGRPPRRAGKDCQVVEAFQVDAEILDRRVNPVFPRERHRARTLDFDNRAAPQIRVDHLVLLERNADRGAHRLVVEIADEELQLRPAAVDVRHAHGQPHRDAEP